jgi:hypothetical protein
MQRCAQQTSQRLHYVVLQDCLSSVLLQRQQAALLLQMLVLWGRLATCVVAPRYKSLQAAAESAANMA